jgi:hypothetical protein
VVAEVIEDLAVIAVDEIGDVAQVAGGIEDPLQRPAGLGKPPAAQRREPVGILERRPSGAGRIMWPAPAVLGSRLADERVEAGGVPPWPVGMPQEEMGVEPLRAAQLCQPFLEVHQSGEGELLQPPGLVPKP